MVTTSEDWSARDRTVLVTGGTGGIGFQTARVLARWGAHVLITGRDAASGQRAAKAICHEAGQELVSFLPADHATVGGNQRVAEEVRAAVSGLDVLVNNVGGLYQSRRETTDGYEATLAMNFVGPFALTSQLLPLLQARAPARCINVVSAAFKTVKGDPLADPQSAQRFVSAEVYSRTKLLNMLASLALAQQLPAEQVTVNLVHPGLAWTPMTQSMTAQTMPAFRAIWPLVRAVQRRQSPEKAGQRVATLVASSVAGTTTGHYFEAGLSPRRLSARGLDPQRQQQAWQLGEQLVAQAPTRNIS
jgi:NAD(P)-dependent dehydrogenase (short-subunit alcohol dehydrogenase family)